MTLVVCIAADCEQLQLRVLHQVILGVLLGVLLVLGDQEEPRDLRHQQADQAGLQQQRHGCQESAAKLLHSGQYRGQRSVDQSIFNSIEKTTSKGSKLCGNQ